MAASIGSLCDQLCATAARVRRFPELVDGGAPDPSFPQYPQRPNTLYGTSLAEVLCGFYPLDTAASIRRTPATGNTWRAWRATIAGSRYGAYAYGQSGIIYIRRESDGGIQPVNAPTLGWLREMIRETIEEMAAELAASAYAALMPRCATVLENLQMRHIGPAAAPLLDGTMQDCVARLRARVDARGHVVRVPSRGIAGTIVVRAQDLLCSETGEWAYVCADTAPTRPAPTGKER